MKRKPVFDMTGHHTVKGKFCYYSVWDNKTDELLVASQPADKCAKILGIKESSFFRTFSRYQTEPEKKRRYHIEREVIDELED